MVENVSFQDTDEVVGDLDSIVEERDDLQYRSDVIREAIREYIDNHESEQST